MVYAAVFLILRNYKFKIFPPNLILFITFYLRFIFFYQVLCLFYFPAIDVSYFFYNFAVMINTIIKYFPTLSENQKRQFQLMTELYPVWNEKINVVSRKDIDNIEINHVLHSLSIAKFINFKEGSEIMDFGSGGGLPGLPLAVMFPECRFHLIDRIGKKLRWLLKLPEPLVLKMLHFSMVTPESVTNCLILW